MKRFWFCRKSEEETARRAGAEDRADAIPDEQYDAPAERAPGERYDAPDAAPEDRTDVPPEEQPEGALGSGVEAAGAGGEDAGCVEESAGEDGEAGRAEHAAGEDGEAGNGGETAGAAEPDGEETPRETLVFRTVPTVEHTSEFDMPDIPEPEEPAELTEEERAERELREAEAETQTMIDLEDDFGFKDVPRKRKKHRKKHPILKFVVITGALVSLIVFALSPVFNIRKTVVEGNHYYSDVEVAEMADVATGKNIFFHANKSEIRRRLLEDPYFTDVKVSRCLPSTLKITVNERSQVAEIKYGDEFIVIDVNGIILRKTEVDPKLTLLSGLTVSRIETGKKIEAEEKETLRIMLKMISSMKKGDFYFKEITVNGTSVEADITGRLIVKGSAKVLKNVVDSGDLQKVVNNLLTRGIRRGTITLGDDRYMSFYPAVSR